MANHPVWRTNQGITSGGVNIDIIMGIMWKNTKADLLHTGFLQKCKMLYI